jgi:DNA-binding CsgD family transcriptional regulator
MAITREELSERELEILRLVATGASNKEIASRLFISANTVKVHLRNIFAKIGVSSRTEAAMYAVNMGLANGSLANTSTTAPSALEADIEGQAVAAQDIGPVATRASMLQRMATNNLSWLLAALALVTLGLLASIAFLLRDTRLVASESPAPTLGAEVTVVNASRWQALAPLPTARFGLGVVAYEGQIYAVGGQGKDGVLGTLERYQIETDTWESLPFKPLAVADIKAAVVGGKIYVPGGRLASGEMTDTLEIFDPRQGNWSRGTPLPAPLSGYALAVYEGRLYLFGGWDGRRCLDMVYEYDPGQDAWKAKAPMQTPLAYAGAAVANGKIYLVGGYDGKQALSQNLAYQPDLDDGVQNAWQAGPAMLQARYAAGVGSLVDIVYAVGGIGAAEGQAVMPLQYQSQAGLWQAFDMPTEEGGEFSDLAAVGSRLYILGGRRGGAPSDLNLSYQAIYTIIFPVITR